MAAAASDKISLDEFRGKVLSLPLRDSDHVTEFHWWYESVFRKACDLFAEFGTYEDAEEAADRSFDVAYQEYIDTFNKTKMCSGDIDSAYKDALVAFLDCDILPEYEPEDDANSCWSDCDEGCDGDHRPYTFKSPVDDWAKGRSPPDYTSWPLRYTGPTAYRLRLRDDDIARILADVPEAADPAVANEMALALDQWDAQVSHAVSWRVVMSGGSALYRDRGEYETDLKRSKDTWVTALREGYAERQAWKSRFQTVLHSGLPAVVN